MKVNYDHTSGRLFYQMMIFGFLLALTAMFLNCSPVKTVSQQQHNVPLPAITSAGSMHQLQLPVSDADSMQVKISFSEGWHKAIGSQQVLLNRTYKAEALESQPIIRLHFTQPGLCLVSVTWWKNGVANTNYQRTEIEL